MKIGFAILSHTLPSLHFFRLLDSLNQFPNRKIVIHHDFSKADFPKDLSKKYNFEFTHQTYQTEWAGIGIVKGTLACFEQLQDVDWIILLSTSDYPIKSVEHIVDFFENTKYDAFVEDKPIYGNRNEWELLNWVYEKVNKKTLIKIPFISRNLKPSMKAIKVYRKNNPFNEQNPLFFGSQWIMINQKVNYYLLNLSKKEKTVYDFLSESEACKDETILQTLIHLNSEFRVSDKHYRYINWDNAKDWHPNILDEKYIEAIKNTDALFARKFSDKISDTLIDYIEVNLKHKTKCN